MHYIVSCLLLIVTKTQQPTAALARSLVQCKTSILRMNQFQQYRLTCSQYQPGIQLLVWLVYSRSYRDDNMQTRVNLPREIRECFAKFAGEFLLPEYEFEIATKLLFRPRSLRPRSTGKQGLEYGTVSLTVSLRGGTSENSVFQWFFRHN